MSLDRPPSLSQGRPILDEHAVRYRLAEEVERALRYQRALSILYIDLERPSLEHAQAAMAAASRAIRLSDILGQWEDHGVVVMFPETAEAADIPSSRVLNSICKHIPAARGGTAQCPHHGSDADALLESARQASAIASAGGLATLPHSVEHFSLTDNGPPIVAADPLTKRLFALVRNLSRADLSILISGETGVGKEIVASTLHHWSNRNNGPFVALNCAGIPVSLLESELFGYERGAFTGASGRKAGQFELADGGTLFLDEIGDMSLNAQAKVLRVLQFGEMTRVGGEKTVTVDVRVLAATNRDLEDAVKKGVFREDLYFRLNVVPVRAAPLRDRLSDIPLLLKEFVRLFCKENGYREKPIDDGVLAALSSYNWPGNVRELKNMAERLLIMSGERITLADLPEQIASTPPSPTAVASFGGGEARLPLREFRERVERAYISDTLKENDWNISRTAQILGIERTNLHKKLKALGLSRNDDSD